MKKLFNINKILFLATVDSHIYYFHIPFMKLLRDMGYEVGVAASNVGFTEKIEQEGFKVYNIPFSRNPLSFSNLKASIRLYKIMKENKYIMLHTHTPVASFIGRIVAKIVGIPNVVYTAHGFHFHEYGSMIKNFIYYRLEKFAGKFTDVLITINKDDYEIAKDKNLLPNGKIFYIKGVGVDTKKFNPEKYSKEKSIKMLENLQYGNLKGSNEQILLSVGRLEREKHFDHLLKAIYTVSKYENKNFKCIIVGDGPFKEDLLKLTKNLDLEGKVLFTGFINEVVNLLSIADIFVFTSSREGLPVSLMEAMAMEKPVVAYNIRGVRDLVEDGVNGFLIPFGDVNKLAEKIVYLMEHPDVAKEMGKRGREKIEKEFSLNVILHKMEALYKEIFENDQS